MFKKTKKIVLPVVFMLLFFGSCSQDDESTQTENKSESSISTVEEYHADASTNLQGNKNSTSRFDEDGGGGPGGDDDGGDDDDGGGNDGGSPYSSTYCRLHPASGLCQFLVNPPPPSPPRPDTETYTADESQLVRLIKNYRTSIGLSSLSDQISGITRIKAKEHNLNMISTDIISHDGFDARAAAIISNGNSSYFSVIRVGEIVAFNYSTPESVLAAWLASPGHKSIIEGDFNYFGLKITVNPATGRKYYTVLFYKRIRIRESPPMPGPIWL